VNVGTDTHYTVLHLIHEIFLCMDWEPRKIEKQLDKPVGVGSRAADVTKSKDKLNWAPSYSLRDGVRRTVKWYLDCSGNKDLKTLDRLLMERA